MIPIIRLQVSDACIYNFCAFARCPYSQIGCKMNTYSVHCDMSQYFYGHIKSIDKDMFFLYSLEEHDKE